MSRSQRFSASFQIVQRGRDMPKSHKLCLGLASLALACVPVWGQGTPPPQVLPIRIPGGDVLLPAQPIPTGGVLPSALFNVFSPGVGPALDGENADPHVITNFQGHVAMGYASGTVTATDNHNNHQQYAVITDIRVYQGDYVGGVSTYIGGGTTSAKAHGTFVLI
jgi:hypothetical protein